MEIAKPCVGTVLVKAGDPLTKHRVLLYLLRNVQVNQKEAYRRHVQRPMP